MNNRNLSVEVKDSGIGIPKDKQDIIFEFFRQADYSHSRNYEGVGNGLAIAKKLALVLNGDIKVVSEPGEGSLFQFIFPVEFTETITNDKKDKIISYETKKILIVEDDEINIELLQKILQKTKSQITTATNGRLAYETVEKDNTFDLILMDLKMPVMDGFAATKLIRKLNADIPIIAVSAYTSTEDKNRAMEAGCNDFITKPVNRELLYGKLKKYMG